MKVKTLLIALRPEAIFPKNLTQLLEKIGYKLLFAKDLNNAAAIFTTQLVDLILLDLLIPPYGAYAVVQGLRKIDLCIPILLIGPSVETCELYRKEKSNFAGCISLIESDENILRSIRDCLTKSTSYSLDEVSQLLEAAGQPMTLTDAVGSIHYVNPSFSELTGFYPEQIIGENPRLWKSGAQPNSFYEAMWKTIQSGRPWTGAVMNLRKDGSRYSAQMLIKPLKGLYQSVPRGFLAIHTPLEH